MKHALALLAALLFIPHQAAAQPVLSPPMQILGAVSLPIADAYDEDALYTQRPALLVDLGMDKPAESAVAKKITVMGSEGAVEAVLVAVQKHCDHLCGLDDIESCHYAGVYSYSASQKLGAPLAAFAGQAQVRKFTPLWRERKQAALPATIKPQDFTELSHSHYDGQFVSLKVDGVSDKEVSLTLRADELFKEPRTAKGLACEALVYPPDRMASSVNCGNLSLLLARGKPVALSVADYGSPMVRVLSRFEVDGRVYYLVRMGMKAQSPVGILYESPAGWIFRVQPLKHPLMC